MEKNSVASLLTSVDSLFTTQEERNIASQPRVQEIPIDIIDDFPNHPFKVRMRIVGMHFWQQRRTTTVSLILPEVVSWAMFAFPKYP